jgi:hypothetical protein
LEKILNTKPFRLYASLAVAAVVLAGCSSGHSKSKVLTVTITNPITSIVSGGAAVTLNATVTNDGATPGVGWSLVTTGTSTACAPACGALSGATTTSVTYTPPATTPSPATVSIIATSLSTSTVVDTDNFTITGPVVEGACQASPALRGNEAAMTQPVAFLVKGEDGDNVPIAYAGSFTPNGTGGITAADLDLVSYIDGTGSQSVDLASSSYSYGADGRGCLSLSFAQQENVKRSLRAHQAASNADSLAHFRAAARVSPKQIKRRKSRSQQSSELNSVVLTFAILDLSGSGRIMEFDNTDGEGTITAGQMHVQTSANFNVDNLASHFAFGMDGWTAGEGIYRAAMAGSFVNDGGELFGGYADVAVGGGGGTGEESGGAGSLNDDVSTTTGRGTGAYTTTNDQNTAISFDFAYYIINGSDIYIISADDPQDGGFLLSGRAMESAASSSALNGWYISGVSGFDCNECNNESPNEGVNYVAISTMNATTGGAATGTLYSSDGGDSETTPFTGSYALDTTAGRAAFDGALNNEVGYLTTGDTDDGIVAFLVGTGVDSESGFLAFQSSTQPNYSNSTLTGNYVFGSSEDVTGTQGSVAGIFSFSPGTGQVTGVVDVSSINDGDSSAQSVSNTYGVNTDGSGAINPFTDEPIDLVTNGSLVLGIDTNSDAPLLYVLTQTQENSASKKKPKTNATTAAHK